MTRPPSRRPSPRPSSHPSSRPSTHPSAHLAAALDLAVGGVLLTVLWVLGEGVAWLLPWAPLPGSLWGMMLAWLALESGVLPEARVRRAAAFLVRWLGLLFVPVGVGVVAYGDLVVREAGAIAVAIVVGSLATLLAGALAAGAVAGASER